MSQTPNTNTTGYATPADLLECYAESIVADMCRVAPDYPPPSYMALLDARNPAGRRLARHLNVGAGEIEAACGVSKRYTVDDLKALTGVAGDLLKKLNCARGFWSLSQYLKPVTSRPEDVPYAKESWDMLQLLKAGEMIFSTFEAQNAGLPSVSPPNPQALVTPNVVGRAERLFPNTIFNNGNRGYRRGGY